MNKQLTIGALLCLSLGILQLPALADPWFDKYDTHHTGTWTYNDFYKAHHDYIKRHHDEKKISDKELKEQWKALDTEHHGHVKAEQVRSFHNWD